MFENLACGCYGKVKVSFLQKSLDCKIKVECEECTAVVGSTDSSKEDPTPVSNMVVYSAMQNGIGSDRLHKFLGNLSMKPLHDKYFDYSRNVRKAAKVKVSQMLEASVEAVKKHYTEELKVEPDENGVIDIRITFDGSWQKCGHKFARLWCNH